jgi:DNA invertase Pin-like site-specific DNA recombinase/DNA-directed RNA polymerase subunit RPC12/RpoP
MKNAVLYARYSSANQTEQSIEGQTHVCEKYAAQNDIQIVRHYIDRAISGTSDKRPQFQQMITDSKSKEFEIVLVYKLDRFARNRYDSAIYKKKLRDNGVRVVSATENITDSPEGIIMEGLLEAMDEYYSAELSRKMMRGKEESFQKGYYLNHVPPFGYKLVDRRLTIDEATAPLVPEIFRDYLDGKKIGEIAAELNAKGIPTAAGTRWKPMDVSRLLHRRLYVGEYTFGDFEGVMPCPQIVPRELYDAVQKYIADAVERKRKRKDYNYMLTGKLRCAECGKSVCGSTSGKKHYYYCRHCGSARVIDADYLHAKTFAALDEYLNEDKVAELAAAAYAQYQQEEQVDERPALERELKSVDTQIQNAVNAIVAGAALPELQEKITQLKERQETLRKALLDAPTSMPRLTEEHFRLALSEMAKQSSAELFKTVVGLVLLKGDTVIVCVNLTDETNVPPLEQILFKVTDAGTGVIQNKAIQMSGWLLIAA